MHVSAGQGCKAANHSLFHICISRESNLGHIDGNDVFCHETTDAAVRLQGTLDFELRTGLGPAHVCQASHSECWGPARVEHAATMALLPCVSRALAVHWDLTTVLLHGLPRAPFHAPRPSGSTPASSAEGLGFDSRCPRCGCTDDVRGVMYENMLACFRRPGVQSSKP